MPGLNRVQLIGRLGKDPETRFTPKGNKVCAFSVAVDRRWKSEGEAWGKLGEICQSYLSKGVWSSSKGVCKLTAMRRMMRYATSQKALPVKCKCSTANLRTRYP